LCVAVRWSDFDPSNDVLRTTRHVRLAWGRDFGDVSPRHGVILGGGEHALKVAVTLTPWDNA